MSRGSSGTSPMISGRFDVFGGPPLMTDHDPLLDFVKPAVIELERLGPYKIEPFVLSVASTAEAEFRSTSPDPRTQLGQAKTELFPQLAHQGLLMRFAWRQAASGQDPAATRLGLHVL